MSKSELLAKFIKLFPCYSDQIQFVEDPIPNGYFGSIVKIHLKSGDVLGFNARKGSSEWYLWNYPEAKNDIEAYNEAGETSGLTE